MQEVRQHKKRVPKHMDEPNIFSGLVFCADCGKPLVLHRASTMKRTEYNFKCYTYGKKGKTVCTPHHIREFELKAVVLEDLRRVTHFARMKEKQFAAIDELTPELLCLFIQRIEVGERTEKYSRSSHQSIRIVYRDIGTVDSAMEQGEAQPRIAPPLSEVFELPA